MLSNIRPTLPNHHDVGTLHLMVGPVRDLERLAAQVESDYSAGVTDILAWLRGDLPSPKLVALLDAEH